MSDWEFLHEMHDLGYSAEEIAYAAGCGYPPWDMPYILEQELSAELKELESSRSAGEISHDEFLKKKAEILRKHSA